MKIRTPDTRKARQKRCRKVVAFESPHTITYNNFWSDPFPTRCKYYRMQFWEVDAGVEIRYTN